MEEKSTPPGRKRLLFVVSGILVVFLIAVILAVAWKAPELLERFGFGSNTQQELLPVQSEEFTAAAIPLATLLAQAESAMASGELTDAVTLYEKALEVGASLEVESDVLVLRKLFDAAVLLGDREKAESVLGLLSFRGVSESVLDAFRGLLLLRTGEIESARVLFEQESQRPEHAYGLVLVEILEGNHEQAQKSIEVLRTSRDPLLVHAAQVVQGAYDEFSLFEGGKQSHLKTLLARSLAQIGQCPVSEMLLSSVVAQESDYRDAWIVLGYCRLIVQKSEEALMAFQSAYGLDPEKAETQYFLGLTHERLGDTTSAHMFLGYALQNGFEPERAVREKLASLALANKAFAEAAEQYRAILTLEDEADATLYLSLITLLMEKLNDAEGAAALAEEAYEELGDTAGALHLVGWMALENAELDRAATFLNAAVQQDPSLGIAWYHKGVLEERVADTQAALRSFRKAYELSLGIDQELALKAAERHNSLVPGVK